MSPITSSSPSSNASNLSNGTVIGATTAHASAPIIERFQGTAADGRTLTAVYAAQPDANVAIALVFPGRQSDDAGAAAAGAVTGDADRVSVDYANVHATSAVASGGTTIDDNAGASAAGETATDAASADAAFASASAIDDGRPLDLALPRLVHWGRPLAAPATVVGLYDALRPQRVSGALDDTAWPSILPTQAESWIGAPRFQVRRGGVELFCDFRVTGIALDDADSTATVTVSLSAPADDAGIDAVWTAELLPSGLLRQKLEIINNGVGAGATCGMDANHSADADAIAGANTAGAALEIGKVELGFPMPAIATEILTTTGHHLRERSPQRQPLTIGRFEKVAMAGRPDFDASLLLSAGVPGFGFERGEVWSTHVGWSGNSVLSAERLPYTTGVIGGGEVLMGGEVALGVGESYTTPWVYGAYGDGLNEVAARFHTYVRSLHPELVGKPRPVILNTWEAVYFGQNFDTLRALADKAAASGVERFVVDDGWFGSRRDDTSGLGDWWIAQDVWPDGPKGLKALADYVHAKGMEFGLWFEPEMINPDSDTFRAHPDWVLRPAPGRLPMQGRSQQVIDLTNPNVYAYIYDALDALVGHLGIDYIKWDHNKLVTEAVSPYNGRPAVHAQTLAVYRIFHDLKANHPGLEIESCSSGGGRIDLGILERADRVWTSDCVDPVERADIQRYTSLLVPPFMMGEHVGASPAHSTGRATSQQLRMAMAFFGHMGVEWNLLKEPADALAELGEWVAAHKARRAWFATGACVHGDATAADPAVRLDGMVAADRSEAVYRFTQLTTSATYPAAPVRLPGLDPDATYRVRPLPVSLDLDASDGANAGHLGNGQSPLGWWTTDGVALPGCALATWGIRPPALNPAQAVLFEAVRV